MCNIDIVEKCQLKLVDLCSIAIINSRYVWLKHFGKHYECEVNILEVRAIEKISFYKKNY